jgi:D-inositol-3-phosphate glycosyltransferase
MSERSFRSEADLMIVATTYLERLAYTWGLPIQKVQRLPPGSNFDLIRPQPKAQAKRELGIPADVPVLVYSGLSAFDLHYVAEVYSQVLELNSEVVLLLIGGQRFPEKLRELNRRRVGTVLSHGPVKYEAIGDLLASGDLMLLPLPNKGFNMARFPSRVGDYLAAGRPVVTHRTGDVGDFVSNEGTGITVEDSPRAMAAAIVEILHSEAEMSAMGARARNLAEGAWSWDRVTDRIEICYSMALSASMIDSDPAESDHKKKL